MGTQTTAVQADASSQERATAMLRAQFRSTERSPKLDPYETEAEELAEWLAQRETSESSGNLQPLFNPRTTDFGTWGTDLSHAESAKLRKRIATPGRPLPALTRESFEQKTGRDLSNLRLHEDAADRSLVRSTRAEAFAAGEHIFVSRTLFPEASQSDRELLAHEVVHTQQQCPGQKRLAPETVQKRLEFTTEQLTPRVDELIEGHFRNRRRASWNTLLEETGTAMKAENSWWNEWRNSIETIPERATETPEVTRGKVDEALEAIREHYRPIDQNADNRFSGDPVQKAAASVLADYLRLNNEAEAAAYVVRRHPYTRTFFPFAPVFSILDTPGNWRRNAIPILNHINAEAPNPLAGYWPESLEEAASDFLRLAPTEAHDDARRAIATRLREDLPAMSQSQRTTTANPIDEEIDISDDPSPNELFAGARYVLGTVRITLAGYLEGIQADIESARDGGISRGTMWRALAIDEMQTWVDTHFNDDNGYLRAMARAIQRPVLREAAFWSQARRRVQEGMVDPEDRRAVDFQRRHLSFTEGFVTDSVRLRELLDALAPGILAAATSYLDLHPPQEIDRADQRRDFDWLFGEHQSKAAAFRTYLEGPLSVSVAEALHDALRINAEAREAADEDIAATLDEEAIAWFSVYIDSIITRLAMVEAIPVEGYHRKDHVQNRLALANILFALGFYASGATAEATEGSETGDGQDGEQQSDSEEESADTDATAATATPSPLVGRPAAEHWEDLYERAREAINQEDIKTSLLILPLPFQESTSNTLRQLQADVATMGEGALGAQVAGMEPFTTQDLLNLVSETYYGDLSQSLETSLRPLRSGGTDRDQDDLWLTSHAVDEASGRLHSPQRYYAPFAEIFRYRGDPSYITGDLAHRDPRYEAFADSIHGHKQILINGSWHPTKDDFWAWVWPFPTQYVRVLYGIPELRGLVHMVENDQLSTFVPVDRGDRDEDGDVVYRYEVTVASLQEAATVGEELPNDLPDEEAMAWHRKLRRLDNLSQILGSRYRTAAEVALDTGEFQALQRRIHGARSAASRTTRGNMLGQRQAAEARLREATTMDRAIVRNIVADQLDGYHHSDIRTEHILFTALDNIEVFSRSVSPNTDRERGLQTAALIVELRDKIDTVFGSQEVLLFFESDPQHLGSVQRQAYFLFRQALHYLGELKTPRPSRSSADADPVQLDEHSEGILMPVGGFDDDDVAENFDDRIDETRSILNEAIRPMDRRLREFQWQFGITANAGTQTFDSHAGGGSVLSASRIERENVGREEDDQVSPTFRLDGMDIKLIEVLTNFSFLPGTGDRTGASGQDGNFALFSPGKLFLDPVTENNWQFQTAYAEENPRARGTTPPVKPPIPQEVDLVRIQIFSGETPVTEPFNITSHQLGGSQAGLTWLTHTIHRRANIQSLEALADVIEGFGQAMMFVVSLHPAGRYAVAIVEAIQLVNEILEGDSFVQQLEALKNEPVETIERVAESIAERFTLDGLFDMLLNGNFNAPDFANRSTQGGQRSQNLNPSGGRRSRSKIQRILARVRRLGVVAALRLEAFQSQVQRPIRVMEGNIAQNPVMGSLLSWMGNNAESLISGDPDAFEDIILQHRILGPIYELYLLHQEREAMRLGGLDETDFMGTLGSSLGGFVTQFNEALENAATFELPEEIVPLEMAIDALIEAIIHGLQNVRNTKARIAAEAAELLKEGADELGLTEYVESYLASELQDTPVDPNYYWKNYILPPLQDPIQETIRSSARQVGQLLDTMPIVGPLLQDNGGLPSAEGVQASVTTSSELDDAFESSAADNLAGTLPDTDEADEGPSTASLRSLPGVAIRNLRPAEAAESPDVGEESPAAETTPASDGDAPPEDNGSPKFGDGDAQAKRLHAAAAGQPDNAPLQPGIRRDAERAFGHSFADVRLSRGPAAAATALRSGTDGLTRGNHITMRPDLSLHSPKGRKVLHHELAHVLQKRGGQSESGARPPSGGGLRVRSNEESSADWMADRAATRASRGTNAAPIPVRDAHRDGESPNVSADLIESFIRNVTDPSVGSRLSETAQRAHLRGQDRPDELDDDVRRQVRRIWSGVVATIRGKRLTGGPDYLENSETRRKLAEHLEKRLGSLTDLTSAGNVIYYLAAERQYTRNGQKRLHVSNFLNDLSLYLAGRSGVVLDFTNARSVARRSTSREPTVDLSVDHLELYLVRSTQPESGDIWEKAIGNSWSAFPGKPTASGISDSEYTRLKGGVERELQLDFGGSVPDAATGATGANPSSDAADASGGSATPSHDAGYSRAWARGANDLKFNDAFKNRVEQEINPPDLDAELLPPWTVYVGENWKARTGSDSHARALEALNQHAQSGEFTDKRRSAGIGLHLGTHHDFTATHHDLFKLGPNNRNSHHITQYLLPEYFHNEKSFKPFPHSGRYPGVTKSGDGMVSEIEDKQDNKTIKVGNTVSPGRGGPMPAILLSAHAHQNSELHVTPTGDDLTPSSQGYSIHREFGQRLQNRTNKPSWIEAEAYLRNNRSSPEASHKLYQAVQDTYEWIWETEMKDSLMNRMPGVEASYYLNQFPEPEEGESSRIEEIHGSPAAVPNEEQISARIRSLVISDAIPYMTETLEGTDYGWVLP